MFKSALAATALTVGALGATAGVANASTGYDPSEYEFNNQHANTGDGVNVVVSDILTNADILDNVNILNGALNNVDVL